MKLKELIYLFPFVLFTSSIFSQVNTEKFRIAADSLGFSIRSDIDFTLMAGNTDFTYMGTNTRFNYNWGIDYTFLVANGGFGISKGESFFSQALLHLRNVNSVNDVVSIEAFLQYDNNKQILLLDRALIGAGLRFKILQNDDLVMRIGTSTFFEHETYDLDDFSFHKRKTDVVRLSLYWTSSLNLQKDVTLISTTYCQPAINEFKDIRILSDNALNISFGATVDFTIKLQMRFDNLPADGIEKFDLSMKMGLGINL